RACGTARHWLFAANRPVPQGRMNVAQDASPGIQSGVPLSPAGTADAPLARRRRGPAAWGLAFVVLITGVHLAFGAAPETDRDAEREIRRLAGDTPVVSLAPAGYRVELWVMGS